MQNQTIYVSATPQPQELEWSKGSVAELVVRPTGLIDPVITLKPLKGQIDDLINEARVRVDKKQRVLVTTLTKRTAEELTDYLRDVGSTCGTCTARSTRLSAWRFCARCARASSMCWSASAEWASVQP